MKSHRTLALLSGLLIAMLASTSHALVGTVQFVKGDVTHTTRDSTVSPANKGTPVNVGDIFTTGDGGVVQIVMNDGAMLSIRSRSQMRIEEYTATSGGRKLMNLFYGGLRALTRKLQTRESDGLSIRTATAIIGVRGTDHEVYHVLADQGPPGAKPGTYDRVHRGATFMSTNAGRLNLEERQVGYAEDPDRPPVILDTIPDFLATTATRLPPRFVARADAANGSEPVNLPGTIQPIMNNTLADALTPTAVMQSIGGTMTFSTITSQSLPTTETGASGGRVTGFSSAINFSTVTMTSFSIAVNDAAGRNWTAGNALATPISAGGTFDKLYIPTTCTGCTFAPTNSTLSLVVQGGNGGSIAGTYRMEAAGTITELVTGTFTARR